MKYSNAGRKCQVCFSLLLLLTWSGCLSVNQDPNILLYAPYDRVTYVANPEVDGYEAVDIVQVTTRGEQANILNTIPQLYQKAQERTGDAGVALGNIRITSFVKREEYEVPYRECMTKPQWVTEPRVSCLTKPCRTVYVQKMRQVQECWTEFRTEVRDVLYQQAIADILRKTN